MDPNVAPVPVQIHRTVGASALAAATVSVASAAASRLISGGCQRLIDDRGATRQQRLQRVQPSGELAESPHHMRLLIRAFDSGVEPMSIAACNAWSRAPRTDGAAVTGSGGGPLVDKHVVVEDTVPGPAG